MATKARKSAGKIVLIEDQPEVREMTGLLLVAAGYEVIETADGVAGLEAIERERPVAALVDIGLPGIDGYGVARRVRAEPAVSSTVLIAVTAYTSAMDRQRAVAAGFDDFIAKPASAARLAEALRAASSGHRDRGGQRGEGGSATASDVAASA